MIAQHKANRIAETLNESEEGQRLRSPIHDVSRKPQSISTLVEPNMHKQLSEWGKAALDVADRIHSHECRILRKESLSCSR